MPNLHTENEIQNQELPDPNTNLKETYNNLLTNNQDGNKGNFNNNQHQSEKNSMMGIPNLNNNHNFNSNFGNFSNFTGNNGNQSINNNGNNSEFSNGNFNISGNNISGFSNQYNNNFVMNNGNNNNQGPMNQNNKNSGFTNNNRNNMNTSIMGNNQNFNYPNNNFDVFKGLQRNNYYTLEDIKWLDVTFPGIDNNEAKIKVGIGKIPPTERNAGNLEARIAPSYVKILVYHGQLRDGDSKQLEDLKNYFKDMLRQQYLDILENDRNTSWMK